MTPDHHGANRDKLGFLCKKISDDLRLSEGNKGGGAQVGNQRVVAGEIEGCETAAGKGGTGCFHRSGEGCRRKLCPQQLGVISPVSPATVTPPPGNTARLR